ncbi:MULTISPECIES: hypothetical protein [unclassified Thermoactinomyces]|jgi:hypothetical protein|uniref:hypothetical protein n=1 Tax=unclassified Thermoactinomyces TaxID=2634588 RepID=UPI0018DCFFFD|nr:MULTISPECIES: hypothetical protein [unclassified Thermoactinomyces]MBH8599035.1 hypothetical protein [Thermoactinomyces sp. CICC 10523]MBH8605022.1 hypothetical protein [Thermoactinomyces sp. CICC 10522]MBH8608462.1 hypothetical protein [Thermoactinomyces sp. CICC 10521]
MNQQTKQLVGIILRMIRDIYKKTIELEGMFKSNSIHILSRDFDPFNELLQILELPEEKNTLLLELVQLYLEDEMTLNELLLEFENQAKTSKV